MKRRVLSLFLCVAMVLSLMPTISLAGIATEQTEPTVLTAYCAEGLKIDGSITDNGWKMYAMDDHGSIGAQWQKKVLYLAIPADATGLTVNNKTVVLDGAAAEGQVAPTKISEKENHAYRELSVTMADLGLVKPPVGTKIPITVLWENSSYTTKLELSEIDWFAVETEATELKVYADRNGNEARGRQTLEKNADKVAIYSDKRGTEKITGGYQIKAPADDPAAGYNGVRTYLQYTGGVFSPIAKHDQAILLEFDFAAEDMPVYTTADAKAVTKQSKLYAGYGFNIAMADAYDGNKMSSVIRASIVNTADGLKLLVLNKSDQHTEISLNKQVGDTFRFAMRWEMDGSLVISVNGKSIATVLNAETRLKEYTNNCILFGAIRRDTADKGDFDISVTNMAVGKCQNPYTIPTVIAPGPTTTAYTQGVTVDGNLNEADWNLDNKVLDDDGKEVGKFGALWSDDAVYMAVDAGETEKVILKLGKETLTVDMEEGTASGTIPVTVAVKDGVAELKIVHRALDIIHAEPGAAFDLIVMMGDAVFSGGISFMGKTEWFLTDMGTQVGAPSSEGKSIVANNNAWSLAGVSHEAISGGFRFKNLFVEGATSQKGSGRSSVYWHENAVFAPLSNKSSGNYSEFEFYAEKMPEWTDAVASKKTENPSAKLVYGSRGLSWQVGINDSNTGNYEFTSMSIYNTAEGLKLAVALNSKNAEGYYKLSVLSLKQKVGDTFRIGTMCYADGSVDVYVNGMLLTAQPIANARLTANNAQYGVKGGISVGLIQAERYVSGTGNGMSARDDMIVEVTNIKMAKEVLPEATDAPATSPVVDVAYTGTAPTIDGKLSEGNWYMSTNVGNAGKFAAKWNAANLYLALDTEGADASVKINNKVIDLTNAVSDTYTELAVSLVSLGVDIKDYGQMIPITVTIGNDTFTGQLKLVSVDWILAESNTHPVTLKTRTTGALRGSERIDGGYRLYDLYDPAGKNTAQNHTFMVYRVSEGAKWSLLENQEEGTWLSFDFLADAMPEYAAGQPEKHYATYGLSLTMTDNVVGKSAHNMVCLGIHNSPQGLMLVIVRNDGSPISVPLNRNVGDILHMSVFWRHNKDLAVYCDGEEVVYVERAEIATGGITSSPSVMFRMIRNDTVATSEADDLDLSITNVAAGNAKLLSLMELLSWNTIKGRNPGKNSVAYDLVLPTELTDGILTTKLTWESSNEEVISSEGKLVSIPASLGELVTLTATAENGDTMEFELIVPGTGKEAGNVLVVEYDRNPAIGVAKPMVTHRFTLDTNNNSVVLDMKIKKDISVVELRDIDDTARFREDTLTLWVSDDNVTYTQIKDFKLMQQGNVWYLYDFAAEGRYVKVHNTHCTGTDAEFVRGLPGMLKAYNDPLLGTGFTESKATVTNDTGKERYDYAFTIQGVEAQRVLLNGEMLYHYVADGNTIVRIPYLADGASVEVTILTGSDDLLNTENKECVYEVIHGTREGYIVFDAHWFQTLNDGTMITFFSDDYNGGKKTIAYSYDGGRTWVDKRVVEAFYEVDEQFKYEEYNRDSRFKDWIHSLGGFVYDHITGRILFYGVGRYSSSTGGLHFIASDDNGQTWYQAGRVETDREYLVTYSQSIVLSTYDGPGPNVDMVFATGTRFDNATGVFCITGVYTTDAGYTWKQSNDLITMDQNTGKSEGGTSEGSIMEREDGVLVLYSRNQDEASEHFAKAYSYDHGITWTPCHPDNAELTSVYTTNTQPQFFRYDGSPLLVWGGNSVMGGDTYIRTPLTVGVTYDGGENFRNLQDLYMAYCLQGLSFTTQHCIINPFVQKTGDDTLHISYWDQTNNRKVENDMIVRVDDFTEYFYRTKGAFDSFEHGTVKYEGWDTNAGITRVSNAVAATHGNSVMELISGYTTRSVPYIQDGKISMQLYVSDGSHVSVNLQCAYSNIEGKCAPLGFSADNYEVTFLGADAPSGLELKNGWNTVEFDLSLAAAGKAYLSVNGDTAEMPVNAQIGDYVCFVSVCSSGIVYIDEFSVIDDEDAVIPMADPEITAEDVELENVLTYNGTEQTQNIKVTEGLTYYVTGNKATEAGTYEMTIKGTGLCTGEVKLTWTIQKADSTCTAPSANTLTYTGKEQALISAGATNDGTVVYSLTKDGIYSESLPTGTAAVTYTVWYKVLGDVNHMDSAPASVTVTIRKSDAAFTAPAANTLIYTGKAQALVSAGATNDGTVVYSLTRDGVYSETIPTGTAAGTYTVWYKIVGAANHLDSAPASVTVTIKEADSALTAPTANILTYIGKPQALVNAGAATGGTVVYSLTKDGMYSETVPTGIAAGNYTVWYKIVGDDNYSDSAPASVTVTIKKAKLTITAKDNAITYGEAPEAGGVVYEGFVSNEDVSALKGSLTYGYDYQINGNIGIYTITTSGLVSDNYEIKFVAGKLLVQPDTTMIKDLTVQNVTSANKEDILAVQAVLASAKTEGLSEETQKAWSAIAATCDALIEKIDAVAAEISRIAEAAGKYDLNSVKSSDKAAIDKLVSDVNTQLATSNLTDKERADLEGLKTKLINLIAMVNGVETLIDQLKGNIADLDADSVNSTDRAVLDQVIKDAQSLIDSGKITAAEKTALMQVQADAKTLISVIDAAQNAIKPDTIDKVENITPDNVKLEDATALTNAKAELEKALKDHGGNYTEVEKKEILEQIQCIADAIQILEKVEQVDKIITQLPAAVEPDDEAAAEKIQEAKEAYDALTDYEKSLLDTSFKKKLDDLLFDLTDYDIVAGDGEQWGVDSEDGLVITANGPVSKFVGILVNGKEVDRKFYEVRSGSTIITLKASYLEQLSEGEYTVTVVYEDGKTEATIKVSEKTVTPPTGDDTNIGLLVAVVCVSIFALAALLLDQRRRTAK